MTTSTATRRPTAPRRPARRVAHLAHLGLQELRDYRQELLTEESRVSYWRRIVQARLDTGAAEDGERTPLAGLRTVLSKHQESSQRLAVLPVHDASGAAPLPDLAALWESGADAGSSTALLARLTAAETELSAYRHSLHERLDDATSELISRYRDEPGLALCALPLPRGGNA